VRDRAQEKPVLRKLSARFEASSIVLIKGENGSGKSTLMQLLAKVYLPDAGDIFYNGTNIKSMDARELRRRIGFLTQHSPLFAGDVLSNIWAGRGANMVPPHIREQQKQLTLDFIRTTQFPIGSLDLDTKIGGQNNPSAQPSPGQSQKIALLRLLMHQTYSLMILDEPTNHLDAENNNWLVEWLRKQRADRDQAASRTTPVFRPTILIVTHAPTYNELKDAEFIVPSPPRSYTPQQMQQLQVMMFQQQVRLALQAKEAAAKADELVDAKADAACAKTQAKFAAETAHPQSATNVERQKSE